MRPEIVAAITSMVDQYNQLSRPLDVLREIEDGRSAFLIVERDGLVVGCTSVKRVGWYQAEIARTCVLPAYRGRGIAAELHRNAAERAREMGARLLQCTTRADNQAGIGHARRSGYRLTCSFVNPQTGRTILVWQKPLYPTDNLWTRTRARAVALISRILRLK